MYGKHWYISDFTFYCPKALTDSQGHVLMFLKQICAKWTQRRIEQILQRLIDNCVFTMFRPLAGSYFGPNTNTLCPFLTTPLYTLANAMKVSFCSSSSSGFDSFTGRLSILAVGEKKTSVTVNRLNLHRRCSNTGCWILLSFFGRQSS